jgi:hypothetical protein
MRNYHITIASLVVGISSATLAHATPTQMPGVDVTFESESAGIQNSTSAFTVKGVETFNEQAVTNNNTTSFTADFTGLPSGALTGAYSNVQINAADEYGGAGGDSNYAVTFTRNGDYSLTLSNESATYFPKGVTYFGYWLSALDSGNTVTFYDGNTVLFTFDASDVLNYVEGLPNSGEYFGNPNSAFKGQDSGEPFLFLNFYAKGGLQFTKVVFSEVDSGGGYESDNHTVGVWTAESGTPVPLMSSSTPPSVPYSPTAFVPEPATWSLMIGGVALVGAGLRARRRMGLALA